MDKTKMDSAHKSSTGSLRLNSGKPEMSQLDPRFLVALADLLTVSAKKYGKFNWALGQEFHTPYDSLQRHLMLFMSGEDDDAESGHSHLMHAAANIMIMWTSQQLGDERLDTRFDWNRVKDKEAKDVIKRHGGLSDEDLEGMHIEETMRQRCDRLMNKNDEKPGIK